MRYILKIILLATIATTIPTTHLYATNAFDAAQDGLEEGSKAIFDEEELDTGDTVFTDRAIFIINFVLGFISIIFFILLLYSGYLWMNSRGNSEMIEKAQKISREVVIGLLIVLLARVITTALIRQVDQTTNVPSTEGVSYELTFPQSVSRK